MKINWWSLLLVVLVVLALLVVLYVPVVIFICKLFHPTGRCL
jgi:hypothetical protein